MLKENKVSYFDNLRVLSIIGVVFVHVDINTLNEFGNIPLINWWIANIFHSLFSFCIPVFVMITGALLLPKEYELKYYLKNRFLRLINPFLFWSFLYIIYNFRFLPQRHEMSLMEIIKWFFLQLNGLSSVHFWYVYMIIGIYLIIPIMGRWIRNRGKYEINYFLIVWLISVFINLPFLSNYKPSIDLTYFSGFIGYLVLGYFLSNNSFKSKKIALILICVGFLLTSIGTYYYSIFNKQFEIQLYKSFSPNVIILSTGIFLFFKSINFKLVSMTEQKTRGHIRQSIIIIFRNFICKYSYGIYLFHLLILILLDKIGLSSDFVHPIIGIPLTVTICLLITSVVIFTVNKLPFGKYISG